MFIVYGIINQIFFNCRLLHEDLQPQPGRRPVLQQQGRSEQEPLHPRGSPALQAVLPGVLQKHGGPAPPQTLLPRDQGEQLQRVETNLQPCNRGVNSGFPEDKARLPQERCWRELGRAGQERAALQPHADGRHGVRGLLVDGGGRLQD